MMGKSRNNSTPDLIQGIWNIIGGDEGARQLLSRELRIIKASHQYPFVWRTVQTGLHNNGDAYLAAIDAAGRKVKRFLGVFPNNLDNGDPTREGEVDLVRFSAGDLGLPYDALENLQTQEGVVYRKAMEIGLKPLTIELVYSLALTYLEQPWDERLNILQPMYSHAFKDNAYRRYVVYRRHEEGMVLDSDKVFGPGLVSPDAYFVFVRPR